VITVTAVRVYPFDTAGMGGKIKAYAEVEIDGSLTLKGLKVLQTEAGGYFIGYPSQRARKESYIDVIIPDKEAAKIIREAIMTEFKKLLAPPEGT
jgi:stage V sporulation protein G